ncbi:MAG: outer membrane protein assembly factor BamA [Deltaproteobacteria bacterium]|nr:outer membrane protein assembly factor BamA [Deltaproteobacteria bacterium]MBN2688113.1 outer membrane protein assembly factor BamA [Deltaproteobacteria bacterium]
MKLFSYIRTIIVIAGVLFYMGMSGSHAESLKRIAVFPFEIYSQAGAAALEESITKHLTREILKTRDCYVIDTESFSSLIEGKDLSEQLIWTVGDAVDADVIITGSLTRLGNTLSADVSTYDVKKRQIVSGIFAHGTGVESIGRISETIVTKIMEASFQELGIVDIEVTGNNTIEDNAILNVIKSKKGKLVSSRTLSDDIKAIYSMGYFSDVQVTVTENEQGKTLTYNIEEKPVISDISVQGNDDIDKDDINDVLTIKTRQVLNLDKVSSDMEKIKALYHDKGYLNAAVEYSVEKAGQRGVRIVFTISEGKKLLIEKIDFQGNKAFTDDDLKDIMEISEAGFFNFFSDSGLLKQEKLREDISKLNVFYLNHGYINAHVGEAEIKNDEEGIYITIPITEGRQFKIGTVEIAGDMLSVSRSELTEKLKINKKDYFDREAIMKDIDFLTETCKNDGYAYANVAPKTTANEKEGTVDVVYNVEKGNKIYFNRITIAGNTKTRDKVIRRELLIGEGDLYSGEKLRKSYMELMNLRYFEEVNFETEKGSEENYTDVTIRVKEKPTGLFSIGAGYSAVDNAIVMAQVSQQNLFGRGQTLSLNAFFGSKTTNYELSFVEPWLFDRPLWSKYDAWNMVREYDSYDLDTKGLRVTFGHALFGRVKGYIGYEYTMDDISNVDTTASRYIKEQEGETTTSGVTVTITRDTTNDWMFPSEGSVNSVSVRHAGTIFQGDNSFTKYMGTSNWYFPLPLDNVFALRGRIGYLQANEGKKLPIYERFVLGGIRSLRGLKNVGPIDPATGDVIGGTTVLNFSAEVVFPLIKDAGMKGVFFYDTGNAWDSGYHLDDLRQTAGVGVRWYSPIGPLRLEWGYVLDRKEDESPYRWEFTIGMMM